MQKIKHFIVSESGHSAVEYAILIGSIFISYRILETIVLENVSSQFTEWYFGFLTEVLFPMFVGVVILHFLGNLLVKYSLQISHFFNLLDTAIVSVALLLFNPVYDNGPKGYGHSRIKEWFPAISPAHNISSDDPPAIVFLGSEDKLIPVSTAEKFRDDMKAAGLRSELHIYEGAPHGFFNVGKKPDHFSDTVLKMDQFLVELGYLSGEADKGKIAELAKGGSTLASKKKKKD